MGTCRGNRVEEGAVREGPQRTCWRCCHGGQEDWRLRDPWIGTTQAQDKASDQSGQARSLWQSCHGEGEASKEDCQSLPSCCFEAVHLRCERWMSSFQKRRTGSEFVALSSGA